MIRVPVETGDAAGFRYAELPPGLLERAGTWLTAGDVPDGDELRAGRVWRRRTPDQGGLDLAIKLFPARSRLADRLRPSAAVRVADMHEALRPLATPRPVLALSGGPAGKRRAALLAYEFVAGRHLDALWGEDPAAVEAFPLFLAQLHAHGVHHGDFHLHNVVWDGERWVLLDLDGMRHPLRKLFPWRLVVDQWARVTFFLEAHGDVPAEAVRPLFDAYLAAAGAGRDAEGAWAEVLARTGRHREDARIVLEGEA